MFSNYGIGILYRKIRGSDDFAALMNQAFETSISENYRMSQITKFYPR